MFVGDQRFIEPFLLEFLNFYGLQAETKRIYVQAERPNQFIGVTVKPYEPDPGPFKPQLKGYFKQLKIHTI